MKTFVFLLPFQINENLTSVKIEMFKNLCNFCRGGSKQQLCNWFLINSAKDFSLNNAKKIFSFLTTTTAAVVLSNILNEINSLETKVDIFSLNNFNAL